MADTTWTANRRLYLDKNGKAVEADDPARVSLLVAAGAAIPLAQARALGLVEEKAASTPPETKLRPGPIENKASGVTVPGADEGTGTPEQPEHERTSSTPAEESPRRKRGQ